MVSQNPLYALSILALRGIGESLDRRVITLVPILRPVLLNLAAHCYLLALDSEESSISLELLRLLDIVGGSPYAILTLGLPWCANRTAMKRWRMEGHEKDYISS
jgi:hypothetical protein